MCIPKTYWDKKGVVKACGDHTLEEKQEAYKAAYADHFKKGLYTTVEEFVDGFPHVRAEMTKEQVRQFAEECLGACCS